jgi:hypothetical protein
MDSDSDGIVAEYDDGGDAFDDVPDYDDGSAEDAVGASLSEAAAESGVSTQGVEWLKSGGDVTGNAWAGPGQWHFPRGATMKGGSEDGSTVKEKKVKRAGPLFDFENLPVINNDDFKLAEKNSDICMTSAVTAFNSMLPKDVNYKPHDLARLFLLPQVRCRPIHPDPFTLSTRGGAASGCDWLGDTYGAGGVGGQMVGFGQKQARPSNDHHGEDSGGDLGDYDDDAPAGGEDFGFDFSQLGSALEGELVAAPQRVEKVQLAYARSAKQVRGRLQTSGVQRTPRSAVTSKGGALDG